MAGSSSSSSLVMMVSSIFAILLTLSKITTVVSDLEESERVCRDPSNGLICELEEMKLKIARLESTLEKSAQSLNTKIHYLREKEKQIAQMDEKILVLQTAVVNIKNDSTHAEERVNVLEEEVKLLWAASRKNNFDLHILDSKVRVTEIKLAKLYSRVETTENIVTEQWIQIRQLDHALQLTEVRMLKAQRKNESTRCTFLKFIKDGSHLPKIIGVEHLTILRKSSFLSPYLSKALDQVKRLMLAVQRYHHELQGYVKQEMQKNVYTAALANQEVVFFVASALITFPVLSAWLVLLSHFG